MSEVDAMLAGPCGLVCNLCRHYVDKACTGCARGDRCSPDRATGSPCAIVRCAAARGVSYCMRDCPEFPCLLYTAGPLFCQTADGRCDHQVPYPTGPGARAAAAVLALHAAESSAGTPYRLHTLGRFRFFAGNRELGDGDWGKVRGPTEKMKALLAFLVLQGQQGARRDLLLDALWPGQADHEHAAANLHYTVNRLRRLLEPDRPAFARSQVIDFDGLRYVFRPRQSMWIDADAFERHCWAAAQASRAGDEGAAVGEWMLALALYQGDFLAGIGAVFTNDVFYDWFLLRREALQMQYVTVLLALGEHHVRRGDPGTGAQFARRAMQVEPESDAARGLMRRCLLAQDRVAEGQA